ncbi:phage integrase N-terminal SAM-like domain-containing protein [Prosthecochloris aestuarii]|uniref:phage integrase N-terminal SAM-like domain-containing protein n=1 Tax=Prosthecochloris aestuarii TaxID=1102 RepID=UPI00005412BB|nr:phage integrase N-terminal SAM-like domain-containing protein [Prosthecochloris aestuarii]
MDELIKLREEIRVRHYSAKTLSSYYGWTRKFQTFVRSKPPALLYTNDVKGFLTITASTSTTLTKRVPAQLRQSSASGKLRHPDYTGITGT